MAWNAMGGQLDWSALPIIAEIYGVDDIERFIFDLINIRNFKNAQRD